MAKGQQARERTKRRKMLRRKNRNRSIAGRSARSPNKRLSSRDADEFKLAYDLIEAGSLEEAARVFTELGHRYPRSVEVFDSLIYIYQTMGDHERCSQAARRLTVLTPDDPEACLIYAQESMLCMRIGIAMHNYRKMLRRWPDHPNCELAQVAVEMLVPDVEETLAKMGFGEDGIDLLVQHHEVLERMQDGSFSDAVGKCKELLRKAPRCIPARNNLALCYFQSGDAEAAMRTAEETLRLGPKNRFAEAAHGKLCFLAGREDEANAIADRVVVDPPTKIDPLTGAIELLSFLGRNEDVVVLAQPYQDDRESEPRFLAHLHHYAAVALLRLDDEKGARAAWKKSLQVMPSLVCAAENLDDLDSPTGGHAPWAEPLNKWIPPKVFKDFSRRVKNSENFDLANEAPIIAALIPALLDRGDPLGREFAMDIAIADGSPKMLDALRVFAFGRRGPDRLRHQALLALKNEGSLGAGPHRVFSCGEWTDLMLFMAEISSERVKSNLSQPVLDLLEKGIDALHRGALDQAEELFEQVLEAEPRSCSATYNLTVVWLQRDGGTGKRRALARLAELHREFPDYKFASLGLAQIAAIDGDMERARDLLVPVLEAKTLHTTEAIALFVAQIQIAIELREFDSAEKTFTLLEQTAGANDRTVALLRKKLDKALRGSGFKRWLPSIF